MARAPVVTIRMIRIQAVLVPGLTLCATATARAQITTHTVTVHCQCIREMIAALFPLGSSPAHLLESLLFCGLPTWAGSLEISAALRLPRISWMRYTLSCKRCLLHNLHHGHSYQLRTRQQPMQTAISLPLAKRHDCRCQDCGVVVLVQWWC